MTSPDSCWRVLLGTLEGSLTLALLTTPCLLDILGPVLSLDLLTAVSFALSSGLMTTLTLSPGLLAASA